MPKIKDLSGQKFGLLTAISINKEKSDLKGKIHWDCICECDNTTVVSRTNLTSGHTKSCGCLSIVQAGQHAHNFEDITGQKFGRLTVLELSTNMSSHMRRWICECECGNIVERIGSRLKSGMSTSCGCWKNEKNSTHGMSGTTEYSTYMGMIHRCNNPNAEWYHRYGGRGIKVCDRWLESFENFFDDMGLKPSPELTIEREDNDGDYTPENCSWETSGVQSLNRSNNKLITALGKTQTQSQWSEEYNISPSTIHKRLASGWSNTDAVSKPISQKHITNASKLIKK